jgi:hypothetical protein
MTPWFCSSPYRTLNLNQPNRNQSVHIQDGTTQRSTFLFQKVLHNFCSNIPFILRGNVQALHHGASIFLRVLLVTPPVNWAPSVNKIPNRICSYGSSQSQNRPRLAWSSGRRCFILRTCYGQDTSWFAISTPGLHQCLVFTALLTARNVLQAVVDHVLHFPVGRKQPLPRPPWTFSNVLWCDIPWSVHCRLYSSTRAAVLPLQVPHAKFRWAYCSSENVLDILVIPPHYKTTQPHSNGH